MQIASSLTFTTLLAIVPVVTIVVTVVSAFPVFSKLVTNVQHFVVANLVPSSVDAITLYHHGICRALFKKCGKFDCGRHIFSRHHGPAADFYD